MKISIEITVPLFGGVQRYSISFERKDIDNGVLSLRRFSFSLLVTNEKGSTLNILFPRETEEDAYFVLSYRQVPATNFNRGLEKERRGGSSSSNNSSSSSSSGIVPEN